VTLLSGVMVWKDVANCELRIACRLLSAVRRLLSAVCRPLSAVCRPLLSLG
jgi:hypothetical protein